jgi:hypothetical protein
MWRDFLNLPLYPACDLSQKRGVLHLGVDVSCIHIEMHLLVERPRFAVWIGACS